MCYLGSISGGWKQENTHSEMDRLRAYTMVRIGLELPTLGPLREFINVEEKKRPVISGPVGLEKFQHPGLTSRYHHTETLSHLQRP